MAGEVAFRELVQYAVGGGWGDEDPSPQAVAVRVIRGTDFQNIASGSFDQVPRRFEARSKVERRLLRPNDIVLEISGGSRTSNQSTGRTILITEDVLARLGGPVIPASFCRLLRLNDKVVHPRFGYYALQEMYRSGRAALYEHHSTGISNFQFEYFLDRERVLLPDLPEQRAIAHILGTLDDKIELNRRMSETLEAMARALFKSWFVDFDPVRAKAEGRDPGLPKPLADLFPSRLVDSELGEIPEGWEVRSLGEVAEQMIGGDWGADGPSGANTCAVRCLRGVDLHLLRTTGWSNAPVRYVSERSLAKRRPELGDVIVEGSGERGRSLAFTDHVAGVFSEPIVYSNFCKRLRTASLGHAVFVESVLNGLVRSGDMKSFVTGTAMPNLDLKGLVEAVRVVLPPTALLESFGGIAEMARARLYSRESRTLATLRDSLLPKLMSGEVRITEEVTHGT